MRKAYNESWVKNLHLQQTAEYWHFKNLISESQLAAAKVHFPEQFYRPGLFVKIGLFFFASIACAFFTGFVSLFILEAGDNAFAVVGVICCGCFAFLLEYLIKERKLFHSGVDNALLYAAIGSAMVPVFILFENLQIWQYCVYILIVLIPIVWRYADVLIAVAAFLVTFTLMANLMMKFPLGKALLPFAVMILSATIYFATKKIEDVYYKDCRNVIEVLALVTLYLGGNYYVVREGNAFLNDLSLLISPQIAFAPMFYSFTMLIPLAYIFFGLRKKDRILLLVGLCAFAFSVFTYRYYFGFLTVAQGLTIAGLVMTLFSVFGIRFLKEPRYGITDEADGDRKLANLEALLASQYLGQTPEEKSLEFGEGNFGGAGAGSNY